MMIVTRDHQDQSIRIQRMIPRDDARCCFSLPPLKTQCGSLPKRQSQTPTSSSQSVETLDTIKQYYVLCSNREEKFQALYNLYGDTTIAQATTFCYTCKTASWLAAELLKEGHQVTLLTGEMIVEQRAAVMERFRRAKEKILLTNNVCARDIDVEQVSVVINFDIPIDNDGKPDNESYVQGIGCTGCFGKRGLAVNIVDCKHSMNILNRIQEQFNKKIKSWTQMIWLRSRKQPTEELLRGLAPPSVLPAWEFRAFMA